MAMSITYVTTSGLNLNNVNGCLKTKVHNKWKPEEGPFGIVIRNRKFQISNKEMPIVSTFISEGSLHFELRPKTIFRKETMKIKFSEHTKHYTLKLLEKSHYDKIREIYQETIIGLNSDALISEYPAASDMVNVLMAFARERSDSSRQRKCKSG